MTRKLVYSVTGVLFLALGYAVPSFGATHDEIAGKPALEANAASLKATIVTAQLKEKIEPGKNVMWCNTFQLAWNELCAYFGEDVRLEGEPPMVPVLNEKISVKEDIDDASCVTMAGMVKEDIIGKIKKALQDKFAGQASPKLIPDPKSLQPTDIVAYAYLFKNLEFKTPFEDLESPIYFDDKPVKAFGIKEYGQKYEEMGKQVVIYSYVSQDDFVIELTSKSEGDRLILAKIQPGANLLETITAVQKRIVEDKKESMRRKDCLMAPKMNYDVTRSYNEITGKALVNPKGAGYFIAAALQNIRFRLDEKGAVLKSEAVIVATLSASMDESRVMIFDKPFLVLMMRKGRTVPYYALWVDNPELLVPAKK
jgi:hypothetical protein